MLYPILLHLDSRVGLVTFKREGIKLKKKNYKTKVSSMHCFYINIGKNTKLILHFIEII